MATTIGKINDHKRWLLKMLSEHTHHTSSFQLKISAPVSTKRKLT